MSDRDPYSPELQALDAAGVALIQIARDAGRTRDGDRRDRLGSIRLVELAAEQLRRALIATMRAEGTTWQEIADVLAVTRQAAQQRYGATATTRPSRTTT